MHAARNEPTFLDNACTDAERLNDKSQRGNCKSKFARVQASKVHT